MLFATNRRSSRIKRGSRRQASASRLPSLLESLESRRMLAIAVAHTYGATDLPKPIVGGSTISSTIDISGVTGNITDLNVNVTLTHPRDGNLTLTLVSPQGTYVPIANKVGRTGANFTNTTFDDQATANVATATAPFAGSYKPSTSLARFNSEGVNGTWTLLVNDAVATDSGSLQSFSLSITAGGTTATYNSNVTQNIPDRVGNTSGQLTSTISVPATAGLISDVNIELSIAHPSDSDLTVVLQSPTGTRVRLFNSATGQNLFNTKFDDAAPTALANGTAPYSATFRPAQVLSAFNGEDAEGDWQLIVTDARAGGVGQLINARLTIMTTEGTAQIQGYAWNDLDQDGTRPSNAITGTPDIVYVIDCSYSTEADFNGTSVGDVNNDGFADSVLDGELAGFIALTQNLIDSGSGASRIAIDVFGDTAAILDMDPTTPGVQLSTAANADVNNNGIPDVIEVLQSVVEDIQGIGGTTSYGDAFNTALAAFTAMGTQPGNGQLFFISDGAPNPNPNPPQPDSALYQPQVNQLKNRGITLHAYGAGLDAWLPALQVIDSGAAVFGTSDELIDTIAGFSEKGLSNVTVYLDINNNGTVDADEPSTLTDAQGNYRFIDLPAGTYVLREILPPNYAASVPAGAVQSVTLADGEVLQNVGFGNYPSGGTVSGHLYEDLNGNGIRETDLAPGTTPDVVFVVDASSASLLPFPGATVGDVNGDGSPNTRLDVEIASYINLLQDLLNRGMGFTSKVNVIAFGDTARFVDLSGATGDVQDQLHPATNANNNLNAAGDAPLYDVEEILRSIRPYRMGLGVGSNYNAALTLANQAFVAMGTAQGNGDLVFLAAEAPPAGIAFDAQVSSLADKGVNVRAFSVGSAATNELKLVDPTAGGFLDPAAMTAAFGGVADNANINYTEPGIAGATVWLDLDGDGAISGGEPTANTDGLGGFTFSGVEAGQYALRQVVPDGFVPSSPAAGFSTITVENGKTLLGQNLADGRPSSIGGSVWNDLNGNGQYDNEPLLQGVIVWVDTDNNGSLDEGEPSTTTDGSGYWQIDNLPAGTYTVQHEAPGGFLPVNPISGSQSVTITSGDPLNDGLDFADQQPVPLIPHMAVKGVPDESAPRASNHTDFGGVQIGKSKVNTFLIRSTGNTALKLTGHPLITITGSGRKFFKVTVMPSNTLYPGASAAFRVSFKPTAAGVKTATLLIPSNDADTSPYTIQIKGTGITQKRRVAPARKVLAALATPVSSRPSPFSTRNIFGSSPADVLD